MVCKNAAGLLVTALSMLPSFATSRSVFAHYMVGTVTSAHAAKDIQDAKAMGIDAFTLNVGDPFADFTTSALEVLFAAAQANSFSLFLSMDLYAQGDLCYKTNTACNGPLDFVNIIKKYAQTSAWYKYNGLPTFSAAKWNATTFVDFKTAVGFDYFFIPDFDQTAGYWDNSPDWWDYWGPHVDGLFSWESAWPVIGATDDGSVTHPDSGSGPSNSAQGSDVTVMKGATAHSKPYMIPLSTCQYKNSYGTNVYRRGELNLPIRMENILSMNPLPQFVQIITWNDGPEGHYIGNLWYEANNDTQPNRYMYPEAAPHTSAAGIISSFTTAFKAGLPATSMRPSNGATADGFMWYKTVFQSVKCADDGLQQYFNEPNGSTYGQDALHFAVVLSAPQTITLHSDNSLVGSFPGHVGLNYGSSTSLNPGDQVMQVGSWYASGGRCINSACQDDIYNFNPQHVGLSTSGTKTSCWAPFGSGLANLKDDTVIGVTYTSLDASSSCVNIEGAGNLTGDMWAPLDVDSQLSSWMHNWTPTTYGWLSDFSSPWGLGLSSAHCVADLPDQCDLTNCKDVGMSPGDQGQGVNSGWTYAVIVAAENFHNYLAAIWQAADDAITRWDGLKEALTATWYPPKDDSSSLTTQLDGLTLGATVLLAFGAAFGPEVAVVAGVESAAISGAIGLIKDGIPAPDLGLELLQNTISLELAVDNFTVSTKNVLASISIGVLGAGTFNGVNTQGWLAGGTYADVRNIAPTRPSSGQLFLSQIYYTAIVATIVNYAWLAQNTFIVQYPMQESDFNNAKIQYGSGDSRLKLWQDGVGYFLVSATCKDCSNGEVIMQDPHNWGALPTANCIWPPTSEGQCDLPFTTQDVIRSSVAAFNLDGKTNLNASVPTSTMWVNALSLNAMTHTTSELFSQPGFFNLPMCVIDTQTVSLSHFLKSFQDNEGPSGNGHGPPFCACQSFKDSNGLTLMDVMPDLQKYLDYDWTTCPGGNDGPES